MAEKEECRSFPSLNKWFTLNNIFCLCYFNHLSIEAMRFLFVADKTIKLWKISERERKVAEGGWNCRDDTGQSVLPMEGSDGHIHYPRFPQSLRLPQLVPMELIVEASPRRVYANAHTYHINSISVNSDQETYLSADDLRINLWHLEITNQSFSRATARSLNTTVNI